MKKWSNSKRLDGHNGCFDREPLRDKVYVQDGWRYHHDGVQFTRIPIIKEIPDPMTKDCRYSVDYGNDPGCAGCIHNQYKGVQND